MSKLDSKQPKKDSYAKKNQEKLARALRENLAKRKEQQKVTHARSV